MTMMMLMMEWSKKELPKLFALHNPLVCAIRINSREHNEKIKCRTHTSTHRNEEKKHVQKKNITIFVTPDTFNVKVTLMPPFETNEFVQFGSSSYKILRLN